MLQVLVNPQLEPPVTTLGNASVGHMEHLKRSDVPIVSDCHAGVVVNLVKGWAGHRTVHPLYGLSGLLTEEKVFEPPSMLHSYEDGRWGS